jgi:epsilon-lactone hydrolase
MTRRRFCSPTGISQGAQRFINEAQPLSVVDTAPAALAALRKEIFAQVAPGGAAIQKSLGVTVMKSEVAGVPVQWISPRDHGSNQVILYFFGGGYITGSPEEDLGITARISEFSGCKVCAPYYRLSPEHPYPAALEDAWLVYKTLHDQHSARSLALAGESAGGNLALALISAIGLKGLEMPAALALLSPWCDLTHSGDTIKTLDGIDPTLDLEHQLQHMARAYAGGRALESPEISPLFSELSAGFPATVISTGTRDLLLSDCARLSTKLRAAGVKVDLHVWEGMWHVFEYYPELPEAEASIRNIAAFLSDHLD